jgi:hypothetical protein
MACYRLSVEVVHNNCAEVVVVVVVVPAVD